MMAILGNCGSLTANTGIWVDEVTTVAAVAALYPYMNGYATLSSGTADLAAFDIAFASASEYANTTTGLAPGPNLPAGYYASTTEIYTLSDIVAACVNSTGGVATDTSTACGKLFYYTKPASGAAPTDVVGALVQILQNPTHNTANIFDIGLSQGPYQPTLTGPPAAWTFPILQLPATPTFSEPGTAYGGPQSITFADTVPGVSIYYTLDDTTPSAASTLYTTAILVAANETIHAVAINGSFGSSVASATYTINTVPAVAPTFSPGAGTYTSTQLVTLSSTTSGATIYYTTDGSTPTSSSFVYNGAIDIVANESIKAVAASSTTAFSPVASAVYAVSTDGIINTVAGDGDGDAFYGFGTFSGDGGQAINAGLNLPEDVATDTAGNYYISDTLNLRMRKVTPTGVISTIAGNGTYGSSGDEISLAGGMVVDSSGNLYFSDSYNKLVREVKANGTLITVAGTGTMGYSGDGGQAAIAELNTPYGITLDSSGNLYFVDSGNSRIRRISSGGILSTIAGNGTAGFSGDGGPATNAEINGPTGLVSDGAGNLYVADTSNHRVRKITPGGIISTIAGSGSSANSGDGSLAINAGMNPVALSIDASGNLYIASRYVIRCVGPLGTVTTVAGAGASGFSGDGGLAIDAKFGNPTGIAVDASGNLYIADISNQRIRKVVFGPQLPVAAAPSMSLSASPTYTTVQYVTLSSTTPNASIHYTTDGSTPTSASAAYTAPIQVTRSESIAAITTAPGYYDSPPTVNAYTVNLPVAPAPTVTPLTGTYSYLPTVTISSTIAGAAIYYTTDGSTPTTSSNLYTAPFTVSVSETVNAITTDPSLEHLNSPVTTRIYTLNLPQILTPTFTPQAGTYVASQTVTIASPTPGVTFYYTTDGLTPTTSSMLYTGPVAVVTGETITAIGVESGYVNSLAGAASYVITGVPFVNTVYGTGMPATPETAARPTPRSSTDPWPPYSTPPATSMWPKPITASSARLPRPGSCLCSPVQIPADTTETTIPQTSSN
jgi:sugar lactone lactonase YvrE